MGGTRATLPQTSDNSLVTGGGIGAFSQGASDYSIIVKGKGSSDSLVVSGLNSDGSVKVGGTNSIAQNTDSSLKVGGTRATLAQTSDNSLVTGGGVGAFSQGEDDFSGAKLSDETKDANGLWSVDPAKALRTVAVLKNLGIAPNVFNVANCAYGGSMRVASGNDQVSETLKDAEDFVVTSLPEPPRSGAR